ncbi:MAG: circularly permuted type 2 ATP-grasp protein [Burkholderiales bacterium]|nr:circularly permuted type 2 ATP-grasp protein [Burkholderiales bacterium]
MTSLFDDASAPATATADAVAAIARHAPIGHFDELRGTATTEATIALTPSWRSFFSATAAALGTTSADALISHFAAQNDSLLRRIADNGVTYNLYSDALDGPPRQARPWSLDLLPLLIDAQQWVQIERGVQQRARLLNAVLSDVYGAQALVREGMLPTALVHGHPAFLRPLCGSRPAQDTWLHVAAFDLARGPDGHWWVMSQRTQAPSGLGYALENRMIVSRLFPDAFRALHVDKLAASYKTLIASLLAHSPGGRDTRIVLLTPGPYNETYFEHVYLARYLGIELVEGGDLVVRDAQVWLKTLHGLEPVHAILRRLDDDFLDPLELRADSALGVPGLVQAWRAGNVVLANAPGTGFLESTAIFGFLPRLCERLLGESLTLPSIASWWCGERSALYTLLPQIADYVIKPTYNDRGRRFVPALGHGLTAREREQWVGRISMRPEDFSAQAYVPLAHNPSWQAAPARGDGGAAAIASRAVMLRVFALSDGPGRWRVLPGGLARLAPPGKDVVSMYRGGSSADAWVTSTEATAVEPRDTRPLSTTLTPLTTQRVGLGVSSRAAENLFWFGRYTERLENATRLARATLEALAGDGMDTPETQRWQRWIGGLARSNGLVSTAVPSPEQAPHLFERALVASLGDADGREGAYSVAAILGALKQSAFAVRERLALEQWTLVAASAERFVSTLRTPADVGPASVHTALAALDQLGVDIMAMTGAQTDRMTRDDGWRLLSIGRHIERLSTLADVLAEALAGGALDSETGFALLLTLFDSTITFRARYLQRRDTEALIDLLVLDRGNPRSLAWVAQTLASRIAKLDDTAIGSTPTLLSAIELPHRWSPDALRHAARSDEPATREALVNQLRDATRNAWALSDALSQRYFSHAEAPAQAVGA